MGKFDLKGIKTDLFKQPEEKPAAKPAEVSPEAPKSDVGILESLLRGGAQGASMGFADELTAAGEAAFTDKTYDQARAESRANYEAAQKSNPLAYGAGEFGGGAATALVPGLNVGKAATLGGAALKGALMGAGQGALNIAGSSDNASDIASDIMDSPGTMALSTIGGGAGGLLSGGKNGLLASDMEFTNKLKKGFELGKNRPDINVFTEGGRKAILEEGGDLATDLLRTAKSDLSEVGSELGELRKQINISPDDMAGVSKSVDGMSDLLPEKAFNKSQIQKVAAPQESMLVDAAGDALPSKPVSLDASDAQTLRKNWEAQDKALSMKGMRSPELAEAIQKLRQGEMNGAKTAGLDGLLDGAKKKYGELADGIKDVAGIAQTKKLAETGDDVLAEKFAKIAQNFGDAEHVLTDNKVKNLMGQLGEKGQVFADKFKDIGTATSLSKDAFKDWKDIPQMLTTLSGRGANAAGKYAPKTTALVGETLDRAANILPSATEVVSGQSRQEFVSTPSGSSIKLYSKMTPEQDQAVISTVPGTEGKTRAAKLLEQLKSQDAYQRGGAYALIQQDPTLKIAFERVLRPASKP